MNAQSKGVVWEGTSLLHALRLGGLRLQHVRRSLEVCLCLPKLLPRTIHHVVHRPVRNQRADPLPEHLDRVGFPLPPNLLLAIVGARTT